MNLANLTKEEKQKMMQHRHECEARHWLSLHEKCIKKNGKISARNWWLKTIADIERIRGQKAADELRVTMNEMRKEK